MFFYKEYNFTTPYNKEEIPKILKNLKEPSDRRAWIFKGSIGEDKFIFVAKFYPSDYRGFMPEVYGRITEVNKILLKQRLPIPLKILFYIGIPFHAFIWLYFLFHGTHMEYIIGLPICVFISTCMLLVEFHQRGNRMIQILITKLKLKNI